MRFVSCLALIGLAASVALPQGAVAESYPSHTVTILVPFAPGGGTDVLARAYSQQLEKRLGQAFVIENRAVGIVLRLH